MIQGSREVWAVVAGEDKAKAVTLALSGAGPDPGAGGRRVRPGPDAVAARQGGGRPAARHPRPDRLSLSVRSLVLGCRYVPEHQDPASPVHRRADHDDVSAAALQYVRKISGFRAPSRANTEAFDRAVAEVAASTQKLLDGLAVRSA